MNTPEDIKYTKSHEWVKNLDNGVIEIGLSDYAQAELGDIVFVNLPNAGDTLTAGTVFADVESVKAVSDIYSPLSGKVIEVNQELIKSPELINKSPYTAWFIRAEGVIQDGALISAEEYKDLLEQ